MAALKKYAWRSRTPVLGSQRKRNEDSQRPSMSSCSVWRHHSMHRERGSARGRDRCVGYKVPLAEISLRTDLLSTAASTEDEYGAFE